jgi:hypothetical protein
MAAPPDATMAVGPDVDVPSDRSFRADAMVFEQQVGWHRQ